MNRRTRIAYDKYYQTENLFGDPYPELLEFFSGINPKGKLLDLGCGQGRDAIALAKLGYVVTGIDHSAVGIKQLNEAARKEHLPLKGIVADIYHFNTLADFDHILLDSIFHFEKKDKEKEISLLKQIIDLVEPNTLITICMQNSGNKLAVLNSILSEEKSIETIKRADFVYDYHDKQSNHFSRTNYHIIAVRKTNQ